MEDRLEGLEVGKVIWSGRNNGGGRTRCRVVPQGPQDWLSQLVKNRRLETEPRRTWSAFQLKWWGIFTCCYGIVDKSCCLFSDPMDCSLSGSSVHGISQTRILEWIAISFSRESFWPSDRTHVCCIGRWICYHWDTRETLLPHPYRFGWASPVAQMVKSSPAMQETWVWPLGQEDPLEKGTATHSSILAWRIPWTEQPGRLQSMGSPRVRHNRVTTQTHLSR